MMPAGETVSFRGTQVFLFEARSLKQFMDGLQESIGVVVGLQTLVFDLNVQYVVG